MQGPLAISNFQREQKHTHILWWGVNSHCSYLVFVCLPNRLLVCYPSDGAVNTWGQACTAEGSSSHTLTLGAVFFGVSWDDHVLIEGDDIVALSCVATPRWVRSPGSGGVCGGWHETLTTWWQGRFKLSHQTEAKNTHFNNLKAPSLIPGVCSDTAVGSSIHLSDPVSFDHLQNTCHLCYTGTDASSCSEHQGTHF